MARRPTVNAATGLGQEILQQLLAIQRAQGQHPLFIRGPAVTGSGVTQSVVSPAATGAGAPGNQALWAQGSLELLLRHLCRYKLILVVEAALRQPRRGHKQLAFTPTK